MVLNELGERLTLISRLQGLINDRKTDEVHELQPLFERGLWMFGPEYEAVDFRSNRGMAEVIRKFFGKTDADVTRSRPDFVALTESSIGAYAADHYSENGEAFGYRKVLIVELKRGGFNLTQHEIDQAREYIKELRAAGCVDRHTEVEAYILGSKMEDNLEGSLIGTTIRLRPMIYENLLTRAHARTFHLHRQIEATHPPQETDPELREVLSTQDTLDLFQH